MGKRTLAGIIQFGGGLVSFGYPGTLRMLTLFQRLTRWYGKSLRANIIERAECYGRHLWLAGCGKWI
jgi:hypothetical protein